MTIEMSMEHARFMTTAPYAGAPLRGAMLPRSEGKDHHAELGYAHVPLRASNCDARRDLAARCDAMRMNGAAIALHAARAIRGERDLSPLQSHEPSS